MINLDKKYAKDPKGLMGQLKQFCEPKNVDGCIIWKGNMDGMEYPQIRIGGVYMDVIKCRWWAKRGYKPRWKHMTRTCGNKLCVFTGHYTDATPEEDRRRRLIAFRDCNFSAAGKEGMLEQHRKGVKLQDIAAEMGCDRTTVAKIVRELGGSTSRVPRGSKVPAAVVEEAGRRAAAGESMNSLAKEFRVPRTSLIRACRKVNHPHLLG